MQTINKLINAGEKKSEVFSDVAGVLEIAVYQDATYSATFLQTGQDLNIKVSLLGENARADIRVIYLSSTDHNNRIRCEMRHLTPKTFSTQTIKGVASGYGSADFYGVVRIPFDSQKCEGSQSHKGLLLSDNASIACTPELEIYADDVKCNHGSTVGNLDKAQLFYLQSRGICRKQAEHMLIKAFLCADLPSGLENKIDEWLMKNE